MAGSSSNWRIQEDAFDYLLQERKRADVNQRRPAIRGTADLPGLGPGIGEKATRIEDLNSSLAVYNGFFSAHNPLNHPMENAEAIFDFRYIGYVVSDSELGGVQRFTEINSGMVWYRNFTINPLDEESIQWGNWETDFGAFWYGSSSTETTKTNSGWNTCAVTPSTMTSTYRETGYELFFTPVPGGIEFKKPGVYTVNALGRFSVGIVGVRSGIGFVTEGLVDPLIAPADSAFGGSFSSAGGTGAPIHEASAVLNVAAAGAQVKVQYWFQSTTSRAFTLNHLTVARVATNLFPA